MKILEKGIIVRINKLYKNGMSQNDLYDVTRGVWKIGDRKKYVEYVFSVYKGIIKGIYKVNAWYPAGTTNYENRGFSGVDVEGRWEFTGEKAEKEIITKYLGKDVREYCIGSNPVLYINL